MTLADIVAQTVPLDSSDALLTPLLWRARVIGGVTPAISALCTSAPKVFCRRENGFEIIVPIDELEQTLSQWFTAGHMRQWRGEQLDVLDPCSGAVLFPLERAGRVPLGLTMAGAHLNVSTERDGAPHLWVAQRAASKKVNPLKWDNCVDGGVGAGETAAVAIAREAWEEAGIDLICTFGADVAGALRMRHVQDDSPFLEYSYVFDLEVPADFTPQNQDGEIAQFACWSVSTLVAKLIENAFTPDAATVTIDWLLRKNYVHDEAALVQIALLRVSAT